ncbi:MAG: M12 family metallopeptidase [Oscillospiraceae bacterium]|nr:M12 family metallopeptidase [Oscillospiraceae bacterium]
MPDIIEEFKDGLPTGPEQTGTFLSRDGDMVKLVYKTVGNADVCEGDIVLRETVPDAIVPKAMGIKSLGALWPECIIPYVIDNDAVNKGVIRDAIKFLNENTEMTMIPRTNETDYVKFIKSDGCASYVGRQGSCQLIWIANWATKMSAVHEILHAAGLWHEQSRTDRDKYVTINWSNIEKGMEHNFYMQNSDGFDINTYDYGSIMHYSRNAFGTNTIVPKDPAANIGQRSNMSALDKLGLMALYAKEFEGPFTDIAVVSSDSSDPAPPAGYIRLHQDTNEGAGGKYIYICLKKGTGANAITDIAVISGSASGIAAPAGYTKIPQDLSQGAGGKYVYICYKRQPGAAPIKNITLISGWSSSVLNSYAVGYTIIPKDLNEGAGGKYIYLCYRKESNVSVADVTVIYGNKSNIQAPAGYIRLDVDLNKGAGGDYIYLCYKPGVPGANGVSDLSVIYGGSANVSAPAGFTKINVDLNKGAHGKYIYLCKKMGTAKFAEVGVISGSSSSIYPPAGWDKINVDLNMGASGEYIYICTRTAAQSAEPGSDPYVAPEPVEVPDCVIMETGEIYLEFADALEDVPDGGSRTIRLLDNVTHRSGISIVNKTIVFDLNGKSLNIVAGANGGNGIDVSNGHIKLANPENTGAGAGGEINVRGPQYGVCAVNGSTVEVTNVYGGEAEGGVSLGFGVVAGGGGVSVAGGSVVTVNGSILASSGAAYVNIENTKTKQAQSASTTTKAEYVTYTDGSNTVWANPKAAGNNYVVNMQAYDSYKGVTHHEMHRQTCTNLPSSRNQFWVGLHPSPGAAIQAARKSFNSEFEGAVVDGCFVCCNETHTM